MAVKQTGEWEFRGADTRRLTHCVHTYPAMMIPQIAEKLLVLYGKKAKLLFDPYCGTGSSLLEANVRGINAIGTDLNPLARLIARTKTVRLNCKTTAAYIRDINQKLFAAYFSQKTAPLPPLKNIDFWFSQKTQQDLAAVLG
ncbi:MAG: DNA methyltransferase, partial [Betaproteobacteria bacterium]|nr:DNA methyltransferase [Betaproteobacteria bacterium]